jgi:outer membrane protein assembly factor BamD (BamD/ComL family)
MDPIKSALSASLVLATASLSLASGDFYEEPLPTLLEVLASERLSGKTVREIIRPERSAAQNGKGTDFRSAILALKPLPPGTAVTAVDKLLNAARSEQAMLGPGPGNLLQDLRDLFASDSATTAERADYIEWRVANTQPLGFEWGERGSRDPFMDRPAPDRVALEKRVADASPAMKPHWLYLRGAVEFKAGNDRDPVHWFERVLREFPQHPRAEAAQFMIARCLLSQSRKTGENAAAAPGFNYESKPEELAAAAQAFETYLARYPKGVFAGDALGWLGAAAYDARDYVKAIRHYLAQIELPGHPEFIEPASDMCEKILSHIASAPDDATFSEIAKTPAAALGLVYLILNTSEADNFDGDIDDPAEVRKWRRELLPRVARAIAGEEALYRDAAWRPRHLAMLVLAASGAGNQTDALRLAELGGAGKSDDLLFARGLTLQRAKRPAESAAAFGELLKAFPKSPLAWEAHLRRTLALCDAHRAGEALAALLPSIPPAGEAPVSGEMGKIVTRLHTEYSHQLIDTVVNFAPLTELVTAADAPNLEPKSRREIAGAVGQRLLAKEQFLKAIPHLWPSIDEGVVSKLATLTAATRQAKTPAEKAALCLKLGDTWAAARGQLLTAPLDTEDRRREIFGGEHDLANVRRVANAGTLANPGNFNLELENRDELRHAFNWWLEASDAQPKSPVAAQALLRALEAMPAIADVSQFHYQRAVEKNWSDVSRKLYERLHREHPSSPETRVAVFWDFPPLRDSGEGPSSDSGRNTPRRRAGREDWEWTGFAPISAPSRPLRSPDGIKADILKIQNRVVQSDHAAVRTLVQELQRLAPIHLTRLEDSSWVNYLDDLAQFFAGADRGQEVRTRYVYLRTRTLRLATFGDWPDGISSEIRKDDTDEALLADLKEALGDRRMKAASDFLSYLRCAVVANHFEDIRFPEADKSGEKYTYRSRNFVRLAEMTADFLQKHPKSIKREAALFLHAKALHYGMRPVVFDPGASWPTAPRWEGGSAPITTEQIPLNAARLQAALDRVEREFPRGRYTAEIRDFRADLALRTGDLNTALSLTLAQLDDASKPSLHNSGSTRLAALFDRLTESAVRPELMVTIKASRRARERLLEFINGGGGSAKFFWLSGWLREQIR